ncbi:hypothetical protein A5819_003509 [Enterococcus sp. 7E2_DIV0204]|uniref:TraM recognition domain-containing protein n=1 Tax=unclassified Enterococcus TaxID=2608891 RepID=UPI000A33C5FD|nr:MULTISPECIES: TraM recognition domain-containing protein [unclassified Enterococcus]OTN83959.1 hypothetical protein A5819_003509 [Enterococcus sp. 7E2_DIV0204]OTP46867.1 hypothetical protein A5884_003745 [Enterococcus sp. 7D2_DIV0200]
MFNEEDPNGKFFEKKQKNKPKEKTKYEKMVLAFIASILFLYPFAFVGLPLAFLGLWLDKRDQDNHIEDMDYKSFLERHTLGLGMATFLLFAINSLIFVLVMPRGYFSAYLLFPFNLFQNTLVFNYETVIALIIGSIPVTALYLTMYSFSGKRRVQSKSDKRRAIKESASYKKRLANKFTLSEEETKEYNRAFLEAKKNNDFETLNELKQYIFIGTDEFGNSYFMTFKEFNQHGMFVATTGGGKTTALELMIEHCAKFDIPCLVLDGKGAKDTLVATQKIAGLQGKTVCNFSDKGTVSYNPIKQGNSTGIKDKLVELAKTESVYYSAASELLIMNTIQLIDHYKIPRTFKQFSNYLLPRNVLLLFADEILLLKPDLFIFEVESKPKKEPKKESKKKKEKEEEDDSISQLDEDLQQLEDEVIAHEETEYVTLDPETIDLEQLYGVLRYSRELLNTRSLELFNQLFTRYEHKKNPFYLYATSENLQTQINILMDSEVGRLFDTEGNSNELDLLNATRNGDIVYVSLNGLIYSKFIKTMAQFIVSDINFLAAERYEISESFPFVVLFDEPSAYLTDGFIDTANKTRGAGVHAIFSPQTLADIDKIDPLITKQLIGNVNTYFVGQTNEATEVDYWLKLFGTYDDIEVTSMIEQQSGYSDVNKSDWVAERGTKRNVENFIVTGQTLRDLRTGEFIIYRKGANTREPIRKVYLRKVS